MYSFELKTKQDIIDFANGCCFFGCGGGGDPEAGIKALSEVLEQGKPLKVTSFDSLKDDDVYASVFLMGSIAPKTKGQDDKVAQGLYRLNEEDPSFSVVNNAETHQMVLYAAGDIQVDVLEEYPGKRSTPCSPSSWAAATAACPCPWASTRD